jgi:hypothetical protein
MLALSSRQFLYPERRMRPPLCAPVQIDYLLWEHFTRNHHNSENTGQRSDHDG